MGPARYAKSGPMSSAQRRYLREQGIGSAIFNFVLNGIIAWLVFRGQATVRLRRPGLYRIVALAPADQRAEAASAPWVFVRAVRR